MPAKKPVSKAAKPKKAAPAKVAPRLPTPHRAAAASRKSVAATTAKPAAKATPKAVAERKPEAAATPHAPRASQGAHVPSRASHTPARAAPVAPVAHAAPTPASASLSSRIVALPDADEAEGPEASSLLAGPRNVKPYVAKRGEQYMSKQQLSHFQQILTSWKRDLMEEVDRTVTHMKDEAANFPDPNDRATQEEEFSLELRTRDRERKLIRKIEEALKRIEDGTYGYCLETGEEIGIKRLEARPVATLSIEAQERRERRERQYGDRDDRYR
jgi:DnaK suppressor protein